MSGQHTQGRLTVTPDEQNSSAYIVGDDRKAVARVINAGLRGNFVADAHRLAACWNACALLTQDHFDGGWTALGLSTYAHGLEEKLAAARALLAEVVKPHDEQVKAAQAAGEQPAVNPLAIRINSFLKGGAA